MKVENLNELQRNKDFIIRKLDDVYYFMSGQDVFEANEIGATIVNAVGRDLSIDELCTRIAQKYSYDDLNQIRIDVDSYITFLLSEGVLLHE
ncbi:MAG: PqqD family protein [Lachnospiraceae bacterium]|nr:PqqD family protein [Lachnospiraceae bacterium]